MPKIFIANVGVNASHSLKSPIFEDGTFEFIPIPDDPDLTGGTIQTYSELRSFYTRDEPLSVYIPSQYSNRPVHNDPEFVTFTYGDNCGTAARAAALRSMKIGDLLLFYARLTDYRSGCFAQTAGFYFIGLVEIAQVAEDITEIAKARLLSLIANNAHVRRALSDRRYFNGFWVFKGSERSRRFSTAVPLTRQLASQVFRTREGRPWKWRAGRTDLQTIGSYLRSCRCCFDTKIETDRRRALALFTELDPRDCGFSVQQLLMAD